MLDSTAFLLRRSWDLVTASRGASDHEERVKGFGEDVDDLYDEVKNEPTQEAQSACGSVELAQLNYEAALMHAEVLTGGESDVATYQDTADAANAWLEKVGLDTQTEAFSATYSG